MHTLKFYEIYEKRAERKMGLSFICLILAAMSLVLTACGSAAENITSEKDVQKFLMQTYGVQDFTICSTAENETYQFFAFTDEDGGLGHVLTSRNQWDRYDVIETGIMDSPYAWRCLPSGKQLCLFLISDGTVRKVIAYKDDREMKRFNLGDEKNAAYILDCELGDEDSSYSFDFLDEKGQAVEVEEGSIFDELDMQRKNWR